MKNIPANLHSNHDVLSKKSMQNVSFRTVDEFLEFLPKDEFIIVDYLRRVIFEYIPHITEKLRYNVPFYKLHKNLCFIWPASVLWGKKKTYSGVRFGFTSGYLLNDELGYLDKGTRKQVYWKEFTDIKSIEVDILKSFIFAAVLLDEQLAK
ncbi:MAG: DUF1801 domain-containing protein [Bacteroidetes bacterium]|nr:DUF1801 domain-containing protein [Bacteroidota bacterium]